MARSAICVMAIMPPMFIATKSTSRGTIAREIRRPNSAQTAISPAM
ncbi:hypothetical protein LB572_23495 [Mesorhizobium sp. BH1-1-5]|nr:hypothetical protein [Mesorhizobium sp. BH1-1-5]MBZ9990071.1 hypothetical protein [Mesorhizobium sp. BH1-1-5]